MTLAPPTIACDESPVLIDWQARWNAVMDALHAVSTAAPVSTARQSTSQISRHLPVILVPLKSKKCARRLAMRALLLPLFVLWYTGMISGSR